MTFVLGLGVALLLSVGLVPTQLPESKRDIPALTRESVKAIVLVVASDNAGKETRQGSGFVVSGDGKIVTNYHVVAGADSAVIKFPNGAFYLVEGVLAEDREKDIVVLKSAGKDFSFLSLADSDQIQVGEQVIAIGSPLALEATVSNGIVSGIRDLEQGRLKVIQTTAPVSHGSSGGALLNMKGEVIGVTSFQFVEGQNVNFAIPANYIRPLLVAKGVSSLGEGRTKTKEAGVSDGAAKSEATLEPKLPQVRRIYVESFGDDATSKHLQDVIANALAASKRFIITENRDNADAFLKGSTGQLVHQESRATSESTEVRGAGISNSSHETETVNEVSIAVRLVAPDGDLIWTATKESKGAKYKGASADVADQVVKQLLWDLEKLEKARSTSLGQPPKNPN